MHVILLEPAFPRNQREFARALHATGARVTAIGESPLEALDTELKSWLHAYEQVPSVVDEGALLNCVRAVQERERVDRLETTVEAHVMAAAHVREACSISGTSARTAFLCRDKPAMKEVLRDAGVACAMSTGADSAEAVRDFVAEVGLPVILKPHDAAGAAGTYLCKDQAELDTAIRATGVDRGASTAVEEFIEGHEGFYDTVTCKGEVIHDFICHYYPNVLEAMRTNWISPQIITTNRVEDESYQEVRELGKKVIEVLGIETSATHMEWFFGPKGLKFSEIGCRPPGVGTWDIYSAANDVDLYAEWAKLVVHGDTDVKLTRPYSAAMIALRPDRDGVIAGYDGLEQIQREFGECIIDLHAPPPGSRTQGCEGGYMANAWIRLRHPDYDELRRILDHIGETVQVRAR